MLAKPLLFFSSYAPLFAILGVRFEVSWLQILCGVSVTLGVSALLALLILQRRVTSGYHLVEDVREAGSEAAAYLAAYLLPFVTVSEPTWRDLVGYLIFVVVAGAIHFHTSVVQINPLLYLFGYRVLHFRDSLGLSNYLICRRAVRVGDEIYASAWDQDVMVMSRDKNE